MAVKRVTLDGIGEVAFYKRRDSRAIRLSIAANGTIRVTMPHHAPYQAAMAFVYAHKQWLHDQATTPPQLENAQQIGKSHRLQLVADFTLQQPRSRVTETEIIVRYPADMDPASTEVQALAESASIRALRNEAEVLLPPRLAELANRYEFVHRSVSIKRLKGRWGSCDQDQNITLNLFLMQLPWHLIDYVLLHELTHTRVMRHGPTFWQAMTQLEPATQTLRREMRAHRPVIYRTT